MIQLCNAFKSSSAIIHSPGPKRLETTSVPTPSYAVLIHRLPEGIDTSDMLTVASNHTSGLFGNIVFEYFTRRFRRHVGEETCGDCQRLLNSDCAE